MVINHWAVFVCAVFNLVLGAIYFSPALFYEAWKRESNVSDEQLQRANRPKMYGIAFILAWMMSYNLAFFLGDEVTDWTWGLTAGFLAGFGWAAAIFTSLSLFEQKSWKYIGINSGYIVIYFSVIGLIIGAGREHEMAKTSKELEQEFIDGLEPSTGRDLKGWLVELKKAGPAKRNDAITWLKTKHGFGHMNASLLIGIRDNGGQPVYGSSDTLLQNQFGKHSDMRPLYDRLCTFISKINKEASFVVKKTYVSVSRRREYAAINVRKGELRVGLDLGDTPFSHGLEKSKLTGPMPRISHMVTIRSEADLTAKLVGLLKQADKRVNG